MPLTHGRSSSELLCKSNRPQVSMVYRHDKPLGMLEEHTVKAKSAYEPKGPIRPELILVFLA